MKECWFFEWNLLWIVFLRNQMVTTKNWYFTASSVNPKFCMLYFSNIFVAIYGEMINQQSKSKYLYGSARKAEEQVWKTAAKMCLVQGSCCSKYIA